MPIENNINELLQLLNVSETLMRFNAAIEKEVKQHGGSVLYSYNNIIIASEISDALYVELNKNPFIEYIEEIPLKKYGEVDYSLIGQLDASKLLLGSTGSTNVTIGTDSSSGNSGTLGVSEYAPVISNTTLSISALTSSTFTYKITTTGTTPIKYTIQNYDNFNGSLTISGDTISGIGQQSGYYNIIIKAQNNVGSDTQALTILIADEIKITSKLTDSIKLGTPYIYTIESTGISPKYYSTSSLPLGLILNENIISGTPTSIGVINIQLYVTGSTDALTTGYDSKKLILTVGDRPIITSDGSATGLIGEDFSYIITSTPSGVTYSVEQTPGSLPAGVTFSGTAISGIPTEDGNFIVTLKAISAFGESSKKLSIRIRSSKPE
jgi:hypothetical protein